MFRRDDPKLVAGLLALAVVLLALSSASTLEAQCAMCRATLEQSPEGQQMAQSFNSAILFLLGAPYLVFATLVGSLWVSRRRSRQREGRERPPHRP